MNDDLHRDLRKLADDWCERRALVALRHFLPGYFGLNGLTDGLVSLETSLKDVLAFAKNEITEDDKETVKHLLIQIQQAIYQR